MPTSQTIPVRKLRLDLKNFRMLPQPDEVSSVHAMIMIAPNKFWGLLDSLVADGYLLTDNIIVLRNPKGQLVVKEGNRRVACMKLIHKLIQDPRIQIPLARAQAIDALSREFLKVHSELPCVVYEMAEASVVDRLVTLAHGKGESASRDAWESVATARHNRDMKNASEPALDALEKYLKRGSNCSKDKVDQWGGSFPLSLLAEVLQRLAPLFGEKNGTSLAGAYPSIPHLKTFDQIVWDVGMEAISFPKIRADRNYFTTHYNLVDPNPAKQAAAAGVGGNSNAASGAGGSNSGSGTAGSTSPASSGAAKNTRGKNKTATIDSPAGVKQLLRTYAPRGKDAQKLATLVGELKLLNIAKTPFATCFIIRSIIEIAAKQFAAANGVSMIKQTPNGPKDKPILTVLAECRAELVKGHPPKDPHVRSLDNAMATLSNKRGSVSIDALAQLHHHPRFAIKVSDLCIEFSNIFPLLKELTK